VQIAPKKARSVELIGFEEEPLPSGRKLLHLVLKDKFGDYQYRWTPPWKGDYGVENILRKAIEIEEWNDYDGIWSKELKQTMKEIPSLKEISLPIKIKIGEIAGPIKVKSFQDEECYRVAIEILSDEKHVWEDKVDEQLLICLSDTKISWESLKSFLLNLKIIRGITNQIDVVRDWVGDDFHGDEQDMGVRFFVWLKADKEKVEFQIIGRELASNIRSFIRKRLSDHQALKNGFEEIQEDK